MIVVRVPAAPAASPDPHTPVCPRCGSNTQVWRNQITDKLTCHRLGCHTLVPEPGAHDERQQIPPE